MIIVRSFNNVHFYALPDIIELNHEKRLKGLRLSSVRNLNPFAFIKKLKPLKCKRRVLIFGKNVNTTSRESRVDQKLLNPKRSVILHGWQTNIWFVFHKVNIHYIKIKFFRCFLESRTRLIFFPVSLSIFAIRASWSFSVVLP